MEPGRILFVDDDDDVLKAGSLLLSRRGFSVTTARDLDEAWSIAARQSPDAFLLDLNFKPGARSGEEGLSWLRRILAADADAVVVVVTGHSGLAVAVSAMRAGAADFIMKPWNNDRLVESLEAAVSLRRRRRAAKTPTTEAPMILGVSPAAERLRVRLQRLAESRGGAVLIGERGVGKTLAARVVHAASPATDGPFVTFDAGAGSGSVLEALDSARGGLLFVRDIGRLDAADQARLAAVLNEGPPARVVAGAQTAPEVAALDDDLRYALSVQVAIPPLRARKEDVPVLARHFLHLYEARYDRPEKSLSETAQAALAASPWPGNLRELRAAAERAVVLSEGDAYVPTDFEMGDPGALTPPLEPLPLSADGDLNLARAERLLVETALKRARYNISQAADDLGITRAALYRRMDKHGL